MSALTEDDQLNKLKSFTKKYGSAIIMGILIALIAFFGWQYWQKRGSAEDQVRTAKLQQLMDDAQAAEANPDALNTLYASADKITKDAPNSIQAIQTELLLAKIAYDRHDYAGAERSLQKVSGSSLNDEGMIQLVKLRLAYAQSAQNKYDPALKTLEQVTLPAYQATVNEAKGDIYAAQNNVPAAQKAYQAAWDELLERKQERQILQIKLESVGVLVDDPEIERPILDLQMDKS